MKKQGHPDYQDVLFVDTATGDRFVCGSTLKTEEREVFEGKEYPVYRAAISSASHPFFTGSQQFVDSEGRVDKFLKKYTAAAKKNEETVKKSQEKQEEKKKVKKASSKKKA